MCTKESLVIVEERLTRLMKIIKEAFAHIVGKLGEITNQRRETVARDMINFLLKNLIRYHHHHRVTPLVCNFSTPVLPMDH